MSTWDKWITEFIELDKRAHVDGPPLTVREEHQMGYLRNLLETALGTKDTLMEDNRRTEPRIPVALPVSLSWDGGEMESFTVNLSWGGLQVDDSAPEYVTNLSTRLTMEREGIELELNGKIVWRDGGKMGIAFEPLSLDKKGVMSYIMNKILRERLEEALLITEDVKLMAVWY